MYGFGPEFRTTVRARRGSKRAGDNAYPGEELHQWADRVVAWHAVRNARRLRELVTPE